MKLSSAVSVATLGAVGLCAETYKFTTSDGTNYVYNYAPAVDPSKPTLLLLHGYPSYRHDWHHQVEYLENLGFGVLVPDCLGAGDSDRPIEVEAYNLKRIAGHFTEILDNEGLAKVVGVGHDWGATLLSRTWNWYPQRFEKLAFLSIAYSPGGVFLDIDTANALSLEELGYTQFGYWYFFNSYDAEDVIAPNLESYFHLAYHTNSSAWGRNLANLGAARAWLNANTTTDLPSWMTQSEKDLWLSKWGAEKDTTATTDGRGGGSSINLYRAVMRGVNAVDEKALTSEDLLLKVPVMTIGGSQDTVTLSDQIAGMMEPYVTDEYQGHVVEAGHWVMLEQHERVSELLAGFAAGDGH